MAHHRHPCSPTKFPLARTHAESVCSRAKPICKRSHVSKSTRTQQEDAFACQLVDFATALLPEAHGQMLVVSDVKTRPQCSTTRNFKSSHLLYEHIRVCHKGEKAASKKGTDTHREWKAARQERRVPSAKPKTHLLTDAEKTAVAVVLGDSKKFACNVCDKILSTDSAIKHYTGKRHGMTKLAVSSWLVAVDQRASKKKAASRQVGTSIRGRPCATRSVRQDRHLNTSCSSRKHSHTTCGSRGHLHTSCSCRNPFGTEARRSKFIAAPIARSASWWLACSICCFGVNDKRVSHTRTECPRAAASRYVLDRNSSIRHGPRQCRNRGRHCGYCCPIANPAFLVTHRNSCEHAKALAKENDSEHAMRAGHVEAETDACNDDIKTHMTSALLYPPEHTDTNTRAPGPFQFPVKRLLSIEDFGVMAPKVQATMPLAVEFKTCHLCEGTKKFATSYLLYEHLRTYHRVSTESMRGTEVHQEWKAARSRQNAPTTKGNTKTFTIQEILAVGVVPGDAKRFECRLCEKIFSKTSAIEHFTGPRLRMPRPIVTSWLVAVDQRALKKQKPHDNLGRALAEEEELQDSFAPAEQQVVVPVDDGTHALHDDAVLIGASG